MNDLTKIYQRIRNSNPNLDEGKAKQQAWIIRDQMMFERNSSAAGAAGAGGAGGGGRRYDRRIGIDASTNNYVVDGYADNYFE